MQDTPAHREVRVRWRARNLALEIKSWGLVLGVLALAVHLYTSTCADRLLGWMAL